MASARQVRLRKALLLMGCTAALVGGRSSLLTAQVVTLRPQAGLSLPTRISFKNGGLDVRQKVGFIVGTRLTLTFSQRFDVVTGVSYVPGYATLHGAGKRIELNTSSHLLSGSTTARYWLWPPERNPSWEIHTGIGLVFGGDPVYEDLFESSTLTGMLGTILRYEIGRIVSLQLKIQDRICRFHFGSGDAGAKRPFRVSLGLGFPFLESAR